ncbi:MAG TPA: DUF190 domain-containing protein [Firmicutes bacterium]|nr:DUF190 domain-containing protein [Bacillota bacterium]
MRIEGQARELRIYIGESDQYGGKPLYRAIVEMMKREGLAGVTVMRGIEGFGANSRIHTANILRLSEDLPMVIVTVDSQSKIDKILPRLNEMVTEGLITIHEVDVIKYTHNGQKTAQK